MYISEQFVDIMDKNFLSNLSLKGLHKYSYNICEVFSDVKMEI